MSTDWDVIVVGLGVMGSAALEAIARRGARVLGIERWDVPHANGSSHGGTRVIRKAYYEHADYVPLLHESWDCWRRLEGELGTTLLVQTGGLHFGPPDHPDMQGVMQSVESHDLGHELLRASEITSRFPMFRPSPSDVGVLEVEAGALLAERCVAALAESALRHGATIRAREQVRSIDLDDNGVLIATDRGTYRAPKVVLALGPWWPHNAPLPAPAPLVVTRQVQLWFGAADGSGATSFSPSRMPVFLRFGQDLVYGLPWIREAGPAGVKVCDHSRGEATNPEQVDRHFHHRDESSVRRFLQDHMPTANGPLLGARVCMYTSTPDSHFVVGHHPSDARLSVAAGFSGHGFKLAPSIGTALARATLDNHATPVPLFDPTRFTSSA